MTEDQRAAKAVLIASQILDLVAIYSELFADDSDGIAVAACVGAAVSFAARRCHDAAANVALIHCLAEDAAAGVYGGRG